MATLLSAPFPKEGTTEETAHVTCVPQQQKQEVAVPDVIVDSSLPSALFPEAGTTEEKAHVTCVRQQQRTEDLLLLVPSTLLTLIKCFCI